MASHVASPYSIARYRSFKGLKVRWGWEGSPEKFSEEGGLPSSMEKFHDGEIRFRTSLTGEFKANVFSILVG
jgi:hypothetical protein